jgi:hypothetical protein
VRTIKLVAATLAAVALAACGDSTGSNPKATSGSLSFTYAGARSGSYSAQGTFQVQNDSMIVKQSFAAGLKVVSNGQTAMGLLSYVPVNSTTGNELIILFPGISGATSIDLDPNACTSQCPLALLAFDTDPNAAEDNSQLFFFTSGHVNVTSTSNGRMKGTFNGTAETLAGDSTITVTNGSFDVPLLNENGQPVTSRGLPAPAFVRSRAFRGVQLR